MRRELPEGCAPHGCPTCGAIVTLRVPQLTRRWWCVHNGSTFVPAMEGPNARDMEASAVSVGWTLLVRLNELDVRRLIRTAWAYETDAGEDAMAGLSAETKVWMRRGLADDVLRSPFLRAGIIEMGGAAMSDQTLSWLAGWVRGREREKELSGG